MTLSTPTVSNNLATSAAEIGTLGDVFLSFFYVLINNGLPVLHNHNKVLQHLFFLLMLSLMHKLIKVILLSYHSQVNMLAI